MDTNLRLSSFSFNHVLFAIAIWSLLILRFGYRFGTGDQVEVLPYTLALHDPSLYQKDFVIQALKSSWPNERTVIAHLLLPFVNHLEITCFVLHALCGVFLILGLMKLAEMFIANKYLAWLTVPVNLLLLNDFALGNLELFTDCFQASFMAVVIIVWSLLFFLQRRFFLSIILLSVASIIHVLEGLDMMMVLGVLLLLEVIRKELKLSKFIMLCAIYLATAGIYQLAIFMAKQGPSSISEQAFFEIVFQFRHAHHFLLTTFPKFRMLVFILLSAIALVYFKKQNRRVREFVVIGLIGVIVYAIAVDVFYNAFIGSFQLYRITPWIKFLGVVAAIGYIDSLLKANILSFNKYMESFLIAALIAGSWLMVTQFNFVLPYKVPYELFRLNERDEMISICQEINSSTPKDALFIQPFNNSELKYYGQRSSYVEFKANVHDKKYAREWYRRIQMVYGVSNINSQKGFALEEIADKNFYSLDELHLRYLQSQGVTHMLAKKDFKPPFGKLILANHSYAVYQL